MLFDNGYLQLNQAKKTFKSGKLSSPYVSFGRRRDEKNPQNKEKSQVNSELAKTYLGITNPEKPLDIKEASESDLMEIHKIDLEAFEGRYVIDSDFDEYKADLEDQGITTYAIKGKDDKVIGYYQLEPIKDGELYIHSIGLRSDLRRTTASYNALKQMQESITNFAKENNVKKVTLDVDADKPELLRLYKKFGFEITDENRGYEAGQEYHDYHMEADLNKILDKEISSKKDVAESTEIALENEEVRTVKKGSSIKELSNEEYKELLAKMEKKFPNIDPYKFNEYCIQIADRIASNEKLYNSEYIRMNLGEILSCTRHKEQAMFVDKVLSEEKLYGNEKMLASLTFIAEDIDDLEYAENKIYLMDKLLANDGKILKNEIASRYIDRLIRGAFTENQTKMADIILSDERLYGNINVMTKANNIVNATKSEERLKYKSSIVNRLLADNGKLLENPKIKVLSGDLINVANSETAVEIVDKILSNEKIYNNSNNLNYLIGIISCTKTNDELKIANKILTDERLYSNENVMRCASGIIDGVDSPYSVNFADKIISDEKYYNNDNVMDNAAIITACIRSEEGAKIADRILEDENLYNNSDVMNVAKEIAQKTTTKTKAKVAEKILSDEKLYTNQSILSKIGEILYDTNYPESAQAKIDIMDKIISDEKFYNNDNVLKYAGEIIDYSSKETNAKIVDKILSNEKLLNDELLMRNFGHLLSVANENTKLQDIKNYVRVLRDAFSKKDQLRSGNNDISDKIIEKKFKDNKNIMSAISIIGVSNFEAAFPAKLDGVGELANKIGSLGKNLTTKQFEDLEQKINPENLPEYIKIDDEIRELKNSYPQVAAKGDKIALKDLQNRIATRTKKLQEIKNNSLKLSPQKVIDKVKVLAAIAEHNTKDVDKFLGLIQKSTPENEKIWRDEVNKYIFKVMGFEFDQNLSDRLNLCESKYIGEILSSSDKFKKGFKDLLQLIKDNPDKANKEIFDALPQNKKTKEMFEKLGINYEKYGAVDENLNVNIEIKTSVEKARKSAIESLENDFNDAAFMALPQEERDKIYDALKNTEINNKEKFNVELKEVEEPVYDSNGITIGKKNVQRLYRNGESITLKEAKKVVQIVRNVMNANDFWTIKSQDETMNSYRETMYTHFTKDRVNQIDTTLDLKEDKITNLTIRKTDMNDVVHSLFLGNHGACCTSVGTGCNQFSAPTYIKNKMVSAIEVVEGDNFVGNTMCYIAEVDGKPSLILDNIELKSEFHNNDALRDAIFEYAERFCKEIGKPDMPIYAGPFRHKVEMKGFPQKVHDIKIVGATGDDEIYLDYITQGRKVSGNETDRVNLYEIKK